MWKITKNYNIFHKNRQLLKISLDLNIYHTLLESSKLVFLHTCWQRVASSLKSSILRSPDVEEVQFWRIN